MRKSDELLSGPSSISTTASPAAARISAVTPPPAPVPTIATSASRARSRSSAAASMTFQPAASPSRIGSRIIRAPADRDNRSPASCPGARTTPRGRARAAPDSLLEQGPAAEPPALQERGDLRGRSLGPRRHARPRRRRRPGHDASSARSCLDLVLQMRRQPRDGAIDAADDRREARTGRAGAGEDRRRDGSEHLAVALGQHFQPIGRRSPRDSPSAHARRRRRRAAGRPRLRT